VDIALAGILESLSPVHLQLCPRQVLGVRIGLQAGSLLGLPLPQSSGQKQLLTFLETDGCFVDGVAAATGCSVGHRTMRIVDHGKIAATFVNATTKRAVRIWPRGDARARALAYTACDSSDRWLAQRDGSAVDTRLRGFSTAGTPGSARLCRGRLRARRLAGRATISQWQRLLSNEGGFHERQPGNRSGG
jgi:hypothetical protein